MEIFYFEVCSSNYSQEDEDYNYDDSEYCYGGSLYFRVIAYNLEIAQEIAQEIVYEEVFKSFFREDDFAIKYLGWSKIKTGLIKNKPDNISQECEQLEE